MSGSISAAEALPRPHRLSARVLVVTVLVLGTLHALQKPLIRPMIPLFGDAVRLLSLDFIIYSAQEVETGSAQNLIVTANLAAPIEISGRVVNPIGWNASSPQGAYRVSLSLGGLLEYAALMLIVAFGWPSSGVKELALRAMTCLPLAVTLVLLEVPLTIVAELTQMVRDQAGQQAIGAWMVWSRFLMGGGGLLLGGVLGATVIAIVKRVVERPQFTQKTAKPGADITVTGGGRGSFSGATSTQTIEAGRLGP